VAVASAGPYPNHLHLEAPKAIKTGRQCDPYHKQRSVTLNEDDAGGRETVTRRRISMATGLNRDEVTQI